MYEYKAIVKNVVDGDTIDVTFDLGMKIYTDQRIRMYGIDTPERGQQNFLEAKMFLSDQILGKQVTIKTHKQSKYGQYLGDVYLNDIHINQLMLSQGFAKPYFGGTKS